MAIKLLGRIVVWFGVIAILLFLSAGTVFWASAWVFLIEMAGACLLIGMRLSKLDPLLLHERLSLPIHREQTIADKLILSSMLCLIFSSFPFIAMDAVRFGWSSAPVWIHLVGALLIALSMGITYFAMRHNTFATHVVKIQRQRGQTVIRTGPYRFVRHPIYSARVLLFVGVPLILGSLWGLLISIAVIALLCARIYFEEKTLRDELSGYVAYTNRVRYRLIPLVW